MRQKYTKMEGLAEMIFARKAAGEKNRESERAFSILTIALIYRMSVLAISSR